jgi:hypothetical protein
MPDALAREQWGRYGLTLVAYIALSIASLRLRDNLILLNWIVGPLFPLVVLVAVPAAARRLTHRRAK